MLHKVKRFLTTWFIDFVCRCHGNGRNFHRFRINQTNFYIISILFYSVTPQKSEEKRQKLIYLYIFFFFLPIATIQITESRIDGPKFGSTRCPKWPTTTPVTVIDRTTTTIPCTTDSRLCGSTGSTLCHQSKSGPITVYGRPDCSRHSTVLWSRPLGCLPGQFDSAATTTAA